MSEHVPHSPSTSDGIDPASRLDAYLDGLLEGDERAAFEAQLAAHPALREQVELQKGLDAALRRQFTPAAVSDFPTDGAARPVPRFSWVRVAAIAAIATVGVIAYSYFGSTRSAPAPVQVALVEPGPAFVAEVEAGMKPYEICTSSDEFATYTRRRLGVALHVRPVEGLALIGWSYNRHVFGVQTVTLLAKVHDKPVVIFMDKAYNDRNTIAPGPDIAQGKRRLSGVVLLEVRDRECATLLDSFEIAP